MPMKPPSFRLPRAGDYNADRAYDALRRSRDPALAEAERLRHTARWTRVRALKLASHPLCEHCERAGRVVPAEQVDHVVGLALAPERAFDLENLQSLCTACHARKSAAERRGTCLPSAAPERPCAPALPPVEAAPGGGQNPPDPAAQARRGGRLGFFQGIEPPGGAPGSGG